VYSKHNAYRCAGITLDKLYVKKKKKKIKKKKKKKKENKATLR